MIIEAQIPEPKYATKLTLFAQFIVPEISVDHIQKFDVTKNGDHIEVSVKPKIGLSFSQRFDSKFGFGGHEIVINDETDKFDYSSTALDPNLTNYIKKKDKNENSEKAKLGETKFVFFHLVNLTATFKEPLTLHVNRELAYTMTKDQPLDKEQVLKVDLPEEKNEIAVRLQMRTEGYDVNQRFNLQKSGNHIQFAIDGENLRVAQRKDKKFKAIPKQKRKYVKKHEEEQEIIAQGGQIGVNVVNFYLCNIDATSVKKFVIRLDGNVIHKIDQRVPKDQVLHVKGNFTKPERGEHIVRLSFSIPAKGFFEPYEDEFNLDSHGKHIKVEVIDEYDKKGNITSSQIAVAQDHKPFKFENSTVDTDAEEWKDKKSSGDDKVTSGSSRSDEGVKKEEEKKESKKNDDDKYFIKKKDEGPKSELDELETLADLLESGVLTQEEFDYKKKKLLGL